MTYKKKKSSEDTSLENIEAPQFSLELSGRRLPAAEFGESFSPLPQMLENDADINRLEHELLKIVNECIPLAVASYNSDPKKPNADALNSFISQSREIAHDIRNLQDKKKQTEKIFKEILQPTILKIFHYIENIKENEAVIIETSREDFNNQTRMFLTQILQNLKTKIEDNY
jgi:hypothetical protein